MRSIQKIDAKSARSMLKEKRAQEKRIRDAEELAKQAKLAEARMAAKEASKIAQEYRQMIDAVSFRSLQAAITGEQHLELSEDEYLVLEDDLRARGFECEEHYLDSKAVLKARLKALDIEKQEAIRESLKGVYLRIKALIEREYAIYDYPQVRGYKESKCAVDDICSLAVTLTAINDRFQSSSALGLGFEEALESQLRRADVYANLDDLYDSESAFVISWQKGHASKVTGGVLAANKLHFIATTKSKRLFSEIELSVTAAISENKSSFTFVAESTGKRTGLTFNDETYLETPLSIDDLELVLLSLDYKVSQKTMKSDPTTTHLKVSF